MTTYRVYWLNSMCLGEFQAETEAKAKSMALAANYELYWSALTAKPVETHARIDRSNAAPIARAGRRVCIHFVGRRPDRRASRRREAEA